MGCGRFFALKVRGGIVSVQICVFFSKVLTTVMKCSTIKTESAFGRNDRRPERVLRADHYL